MKVIVLLSLVAFFAIQLHHSAAEEFQCETSVAYKENDCNACFCGPTGDLACTEKFCTDVNYEKLQNCEVGTTFQKGCNQCWCVKDQGTICTDKKC